ncbi:MAG: hypothetical protein U1D31_00945 [Patescibacteria group bacterium]|nr:hypothetical protein [bacterium]MDZ4240687.1 hypothetical protein [Patescibacteria group bacterium]
MNLKNAEVAAEAANADIVMAPATTIIPAKTALGAEGTAVARFVTVREKLKLNPDFYNHAFIYSNFTGNGA